MQRFIHLLILSFGLPLLADAQHCPFDGGVMVILKVTGPDGKPVTRLTTPIYLAEQPNPNVDSCTYADKQLLRPFDLPQKNLVEKYSGSWEERASLYLKDCVFSQPGYFVVVLNQAQHHCMIPVNNEYRYVLRRFDIRRISDTENTLLVTVPPEKIYPLCTAHGHWSRMEAISIQLE